jgi:hypothetical protein
MAILSETYQRGSDRGHEIDAFGNAAASSCEIMLVLADT